MPSKGGNVEQSRVGRAHWECAQQGTVLSVQLDRKNRPCQYYLSSSTGVPALAAPVVSFRRLPSRFVMTTMMVVSLP